MDFRRLVEPALRFEAMCSAVRLLVAIQGYRSEHGRLPRDLEELVPEHLESVPEDPFLPGPLRYDPSRNLIYSVGPDTIDDKGELGILGEEDDQPELGMLHGFEEGDLVFRFEFPGIGE